MQRRANINKIIEELKREIEALLNESPAQMPTDIAERGTHLKGEFKQLREHIDVLRIEDTLPICETALLYEPVGPVVKRGCQWVVEKSMVGDISLHGKLNILTPITFMVAAPDNRHVCIATEKGVLVYEVETGLVFYCDPSTDSFLASCNTFKHALTKEIRVAFSGDSKKLYVCNEDAFIRVYDLQLRRAVRIPFNGVVTAISMNFNERWVPCDGEEGDCEEKEVEELRLQNVEIVTTKIKLGKGDRKYVGTVFVVSKKRVYLINDSSICEITKLSESEIICAFVVDNFLIAGTLRGDVVIKNMESNDLKITRVHPSKIYSMDISPDRVHLVTGGSDCRARVSRIDFETLSLEPIGIEMKHTDAVLSVAFCDNFRIVTGSRDHTFRVWNFDGEEMVVMTVKEPVVSVVVVGSVVMSAVADSFVYVWQIS